MVCNGEKFSLYLSQCFAGKADFIHRIKVNMQLISQFRLFLISNVCVVQFRSEQSDLVAD